MICMGRKEIRQNKLKNFILKHGYLQKDNRKLAKIFHVSFHTMTNDLYEISDDLITKASEQSKTRLILRINNRIPYLKDIILIKLYESFFPKQQHVKVAEETQLVVKMWNLSHEKEKSE